MDKNKKLKKLEELKFDTIGDEYIFLYEIILSSHLSHILTEEKEKPTIEFLREVYKDVVKNDTLDKKYAGSKRYWFPIQEKAVVDYINSTDIIERNKIFNKHLHKPLNKLIENIIFTYKLYRTDDDVKVIQQDCLTFLMQKIERFNPQNGAQAFSYLGTVAKHKLMGDKREAYKNLKVNADIDENMEEANSKPENVYHIEEEDETDTNLLFFNKIVNKLEEDMLDKNSKLLPNDRKVAEAIVFLFRNHELLEAYNKNKIYLFFKEQTLLQTKDITYSLQRLRKIYKQFKTKFISDQE